MVENDASDLQNSGSRSEIVSIAGGILLAGRKGSRKTLVSFVEGLTGCACSYSVPGQGGPGGPTYPVSDGLWLRSFAASRMLCPRSKGRGCPHHLERQLWLSVDWCS